MAARLVLLFLLVAAFFAAACGDDRRATDDALGDPVQLVFDGTTLRLVCTARKCNVGIVADDGVFVFVEYVLPTGEPIETESRVLQPTDFGDVEIVTGDGDDRVTLVDVGLPGALRIDTGNGDDRLDLCDAGVRGDAEILTGRGKDHVTLEPGRYGAQLWIDTGPEDDALELFGGGYHGEVVVQTGTGNDDVQIWSTAFQRTARIDLGPDHDTIAGDYDVDVPVRFDGGPGRDVLGSLFHVPHPGLTVRNFER